MGGGLNNTYIHRLPQNVVNLKLDLFLCVFDSPVGSSFGGGMSFYQEIRSLYVMASHVLPLALLHCELV
jgi:hypothetical protein